RLLSLSSPRPPRDLPSFPTRRSSDLSVARVPLPARLIPPVLRRLGRKDEDGLPANAIAAPLPAGAGAAYVLGDSMVLVADGGGRDRKSTRLNSSHVKISYAVFCLKKK